MASSVSESLDRQAETRLPAATLQDLYCAAFQCSTEEFEKHVLFHCAHSPVLARLMWQVDPDYFLPDLQIIHVISRFQSFSDCRHEVEAARRANPPRGFFRKTLKIRLSGQRLLKLASKLFLHRSLPSRTRNSTD